MKTKKISIFDKYKFFMRCRESKKYLDCFEKAIVLGDGFIRNAYILIFEVEQ